MGFRTILDFLKSGVPQGDTDQTVGPTTSRRREEERTLKLWCCGSRGRGVGYLDELTGSVKYLNFVCRLFWKKKWTSKSYGFLKLQEITRFGWTRIYISKRSSNGDQELSTKTNLLRWFIEVEVEERSHGHYVKTDRQPVEGNLQDGRGLQVPRTYVRFPERRFRREKNCRSVWEHLQVRYLKSPSRSLRREERGVTGSLVGSKGQGKARKRGSSLRTQRRQ